MKPRSWKLPIATLVVNSDFGRENGIVVWEIPEGAIVLTREKWERIQTVLERLANNYVVKSGISSVDALCQSRNAAKKLLAELFGGETEGV